MLKRKLVGLSLNLVSDTSGNEILVLVSTIHVFHKIRSLKIAPKSLYSTLRPQCRIGVEVARSTLNRKARVRSPYPALAAKV